MEVNSESLRTLGIMFSARFQNALKAAQTMWQRIAEDVPATTKTMEYGWLKDLPRIREWIGDRHINSLEVAEYQIKEKKWEGTLAVDRDDIETDNVGIYSSRLAKMGSAAGSHYDELLWPLLNGGFANLCFDGQPYFSANHPIYDKNGVQTVYANTDGGAGTPWFLVATDALLKPLVLQRRKPFEFVSKTQLTDDSVFKRNEFLYGTDARHNAGYGLPQVAWGSQQPLDAAHFETAIQSLQSMTTDYAHNLGFRTFALFVPPTLRSAGKTIVTAERNADGSTNINYQAADLQIVPWLAD